MGVQPFYYWSQGSRFAFSSSPLRLFEVPGIERRLNRRWLASSVRLRGFDEHAEATVFESIRALPPATSLIAGAGGIRKRVYWTPSPNAVTLPQREDEVFEGLRSVLFEAVACRVDRRSAVAACLSGGLDSSSLVAIASRYLEKKNRSLVALAAVIPESSKPQFSDEREFIDEFRLWPNLRIEYVAPESAGPFDRIEDDSAFFATPFYNSRRYLMDAISDAARRVQADVLLSGQGGEAGPTTHANGYYLDLLTRFRWPQLARDLVLLRRNTGRSPFRVLGAEVRGLVLPPRPQSRALVNPAFLGEAGPYDLCEVTSARFGERQLRMARRRMASNQVMTGHVDSTPPFSLPYMDKRIVEFCLAMPGNLKVRGGTHRYPIRRSLDGILPPRIQWRTSKSPFAPDYRKRYESQLHKARSFVGEIGERDPVRSIVEVDRLRAMLERPDDPLTRAKALTVIPNSIYLICFLRQFADFRL